MVTDERAADDQLLNTFINGRTIKIREFELKKYGLEEIFVNIMVMENNVL